MTPTFGKCRRLRLLLASFFIFSTAAAEARVMPGFHDVLGDVLPGVVHIQSRERPMRPPGYLNPRQYFFQSPSPQGASRFPLGTGFLIRQRGYCVTSFRVVEGSENLEVVSADHRIWKASLVGGDRSYDLAVLKLEAGGPANGLDFADSSRVSVGDAVLAIGQPLGFQPIIAGGMIAATGHVLGEGAYDRHFLLDFPIHPGNTGGPIIDSRGRVIAMASYAPSGPADLGFALPSKLLQASLNDLLRHGKIVRPWLGIVAKSLASIDSLGEIHDASVRSGLLVENLIVDGPAAKAGLQVGDLLIASGKSPLQNPAQLQDLLAKRKAGEQLSIQLYRRKQGLITVTIVLAEIPSAVDLPLEADLL